MRPFSGNRTWELVTDTSLALPLCRNRFLSSRNPPRGCNHESKEQPVQGQTAECKECIWQCPVCDPKSNPVQGQTAAHDRCIWQQPVCDPKSRESIWQQPVQGQTVAFENDLQDRAAELGKFLNTVDQWHDRDPDSLTQWRR